MAFPTDLYGIVIEHLGGLSEAENLIRRVKALIDDHRLAVLNWGWNQDGLVINFKAAEDCAIFRLFWIDDSSTILSE